jgi:signal transduction histidine kinase
MAASSEPVRPRPAFKPSRLVILSLYLFSLAVVGRTLARINEDPSLPPVTGFFLGLELAFLVLFTIVLLLPGLPGKLFHVYLVIQTCIVLAMLIRVPDMDFVTGLFLPLSYQIALMLSGRMRWAWVILIECLIGGTLAFFMDPLRGLGLELTTMAGVIVLVAYLSTVQEVEAERCRSQSMLSELEEANRRLQAFSGQVEELAAIEERNRLARELHDSVSQTMFSIVLNIRSARLVREKDPARFRSQLQLLRELCQSALVEMRSLIAQLRPKPD